MKAFTYIRATSAEHALQSFPIAMGKYIAGGTNLLDLMKLQLETPETLVDISHLPLNSVEGTPEGGLKIGALVSNSELAAHPLVRERYPLLSRALLAGASGQLRNKASTGGNLLQRTRCYYFYAPSSACNKRKPGSGCPARDGFNRMHAILGTSDYCIAQHPSDMAVAMCALDAVVHTQLAVGQNRDIALADFYCLPASQPEMETVLEPGELITHITLPAPPPGKSLYYKVRDRASYAFALVSVAAVVEMQGKTLQQVRLAFGGIGTMPWRDPQVERVLQGNTASAELFAHAADVLLRDAQGFGDNNFKIPLTRRLLTAVLTQLTQGEEL